MEHGARSLAEAVSRAEGNVLRAEADMEALVGEPLLDNARLLAELGSRQAYGLLSIALLKLSYRRWI